MMYAVYKQQVKLTKYEYQTIKELCHTAKNLWNETIYFLRNYAKKTGRYMPYEGYYHELKYSQNYKKLNTQIAQQLLRQVDAMYASYFTYKENNPKAKKPGYLPKKGYHNLIINRFRISEDGKSFKLPFNIQWRDAKNKKGEKIHPEIWIEIPPKMCNEKIVQINIIPRQDARYFEIQYIYKVQEASQSQQHQHILAIDLGVNNFCTCATNFGKTFIVDGKQHKSRIQWYNKEIARLASIKDHQKIKGRTRRMYYVDRKYNNRTEQFTSKSARIIINYCIENTIDTIVLGYNKYWKQCLNLDKVNNQKIAYMPYYKFKNKLMNLCKLYGISFIEQEESYTSLASFFDNDYIPVFGDPNASIYKYSGRRPKRGLYVTSKGKRLNADVNGALNIMRKSSITNLSVLINRGDVDTPKRIRVI